MNGLWVFVAVLLSWLKLLDWMDFWFQERLINIKSIAWKCEDLNLQILMCLNEWSWFGSLYELICFEVFKCPIWCEIKTRSACMMVGNFANISIWNFSEEILCLSDDVLIPLAIWFGLFGGEFGTWGVCAQCLVWEFLSIKQNDLVGR